MINMLTYEEIKRESDLGSTSEAKPMYMEIVDMRPTRWKKLKHRTQDPDQNGLYILTRKEPNPIRLGLWEEHRLHKFQGWEKISLLSEEPEVWQSIEGYDDSPLTCVSCSGYVQCQPNCTLKLTANEMTIHEWVTKIDPLL